MSPGRAPGRDNKFVLAYVQRRDPADDLLIVLRLLQPPAHLPHLADRAPEVDTRWARVERAIQEKTTRLSEADRNLPRMTGASAEACPDQHDLAIRWLDRLGVRHGRVMRLAGGRSKADLFLLRNGAEGCVLKVTTSDSWRAQALRELRFYQYLATTLPIPVPRLLAFAVTSEGVCLLMSAHASGMTATDWSHKQWMEAATEAGQLHRHGRSLRPPAWLRRRSGFTEKAVLQAVDQWHKLGHPTLAEQLPELVAEVSRVLGRAQPTVIHGDCHVENLLASGEVITWVDWQEVAAGAGPEDLALLWQRAEFDGALPPRTDMIAAYQEALGPASNKSLERQVLAAELRLLLVEWPHFLPYGDSRQQETMLQRLEHTRQRWGA